MFNLLYFGSVSSIVKKVFIHDERIITGVSMAHQLHLLQPKNKIKMLHNFDLLKYLSSLSGGEAEVWCGEMVVV